MKKVFVGLSGGVDSSVSAALLQKAGYEVTGVFIRVWQPAFAKATAGKPDFFGNCQAADDRLDAMRVCAKLGIPFRELNLEREYKREVVNSMIREYRAGRTPNPDVACNRFVKFGKFYEWARAQGADFVATGHYARIEKNKLLAGTDVNKDQSYFLWQIQREQLPHLLFPVGEMEKPAVRKIAKRLGLITADKKDSQGLCFVGKVDMKEFLSHYIQPKKGAVLNEQEEKIDEHEGAFFYTIGERIAGQYVVGKDIRKNILFVSRRNPDGAFAQAPCLPPACRSGRAGRRREVEIADCNWVGKPPRVSERLAARLRYRAPLASCKIMQHSVLHKKVQVVFDAPQLAAPGQSLVVYRGEELVGGGVIV